MNTFCEHIFDKDDHLLLDDGNAFEQECLKCRRKSNNYMNSVNNDVRNFSRIVNNGAPIDNEQIIINDTMNNLEDSPLLINTNFGELSTSFHCHDNYKRFDDSKHWKKLVIATLLCFFFMIAEFIGGYLAGSSAVMSDAVHLFSDVIGFAISLLAMWLARKAATKYMTFGYHRTEVVGAFLSVLTIWVLAGVFLFVAVNRLIRRDFEINADTMMTMACLGVIVNIAMGVILHGSCHIHGHSHGLAAQNYEHVNDENINIRAATLHVLGDLIQSIGVLVASIIIKFNPAAKIADPICTIIFAVVVVISTVSVAKDSIWLLLEGSPKNSTALASDLLSIPRVRHLHSLHIWTLAPGKDALAVHLAVDPTCDRDIVLQKAMMKIKKQLNVISSTIQIELYEPELIGPCNDCQFIYC